MKTAEQSSHQLLIQKLLVSIHYLTLFRDEIVLVEKTPSLLGGSFSPFIVQSELGDILTAVDLLEQQERLIKSTFWYDETSFKLMNHSLDIVGNWLRGIDHVLETCESKSVFQAILGDKRANVFGILIDVFTSLRITNLSIIEEAEAPIFLETFQNSQFSESRPSKQELLTKIDAMVPKNKTINDEEEEKVQEILPTITVEDLVKQLRHRLFDRANSQTYVIDAGGDLNKTIVAYNAFDRFSGCYDNIDDTLVLLEEVLKKVDSSESEENQSKIYLLIYGENILSKDSRFDSLMAELDAFQNEDNFEILSYRAYD